MYVLLHDHEAADGSRVIALSEEIETLKRIAEKIGTRGAWLNRQNVDHEGFSPKAAEIRVINGPTHEESFRILWTDIV